MSQETFDEGNLYKSVLDKCRGRFVSDVEPVTLLDVLLEKEFIDHDQYRDISELRLTSEKNRQILETARYQGKKGYRSLKICLRKSRQVHIVEYMTQIEKEVKAKREKDREKKVSVEMPGKPRQITDEDLVFIGSAIGKNWELLGPLLGLSNVQLSHLERNFPTVERQIYHMLQHWKQQRNDGSSVEDLFLILKKAPSSVQIDFSHIMQHFHGYSGSDHSFNSISRNKLPMTFKETVQISNATLVEQPMSAQCPGNEGADKQTFPTNFATTKAYSKSPNGHSTDMLDEKRQVDQIDAATFPSETSSETSVPSDNRHTTNIPEVALGRYKEPVKESAVSNEIGRAINSLQFVKEALQCKSYISVQHDDQRSDQALNIATNNSKRTKSSEAPVIFKSRQVKESRECFHDGRLVLLDKIDCEMLKLHCSNTKPMEGGFGDVYLSEEKIHPIDIKIALKEINCADSETTKRRKVSVNNEQLASRVMHFAIVPLLGMGLDTDKTIYWFVSPRLEKGDLYTLISEDTKRIDAMSGENIELTHERRIKILYHIVAAVHFLHTEIEKFRGPIIHLDVKTRNVVLDENYNARLTDFGVARETPASENSIDVTQTAIPTSKGYYETPILGTLHKYFDYFNIGVVIMELLTGQPPCFTDENGKEEMLKNITTDDLKEYYVQSEVWKDCATIKDHLKQLSQFCFKTAKNTGSNETEKSTSQKILEESKSLIKQCNHGLTWERSPEHDKCDMCMVNPSVANDLFSHNNCSQPLRVCVSCMRNSYLNPLLCHSCFQEIDPLIGGSKSGAVLVAGQYDNNRDLTELSTENIIAVEETITSKCPLVMGLRQCLVKRIPQIERHSLRQYSGASDQIHDAFIEFKEKGLKTIFYYFSGLYSKEDGFILKIQDAEPVIPSKDNECQSMNMSLLEFQDIIRAFIDETERETRVIIVLDCPGAPFLTFDDQDIQRKTVQLKSCLPELTNTRNPTSDRGLFTKLFLQGLKRQDKSSCFLREESKSCDICPMEGKDFITLGNINTYITRHMKVIIGDTAEALQSSMTDTKIAYLVETNDKMSFTLQFDEGQKHCEIACGYFNKICQLKKVLFKEFMEKLNANEEKSYTMGLNADTYFDILEIFIKTGPKDKHKKEFLNLEEVLSAWNGKRKLFVEMREMSMIANGMVGLFRSEINTKFFKLVENWEYAKQDDVDKTVFKIEINTFIERFQTTDMRRLRFNLLQIRKAVETAELQITVPVNTDKQGVKHQSKNFLCYKIERF